jgi:hypothetical protein
MADYALIIETIAMISIALVHKADTIVTRLFDAVDSLFNRRFVLSRPIGEQA